MRAAGRSRFVYVIYIRSTPQKVWKALTDSKFIRQYWFGMDIQSAWKKGSPWKMTLPDGMPTDTGKILEIEPPKRMVIHWQHEWQKDIKAEGPGRCTIELKKVQASVRVTITHEINRPKSKLIEAVAGGWPLILSNLKSLLENGKIAVKDHPRH